MSKKTYIFDSAIVGMRKVTRSVWSVVRTILGLLLVSLSFLIVFYIIVSRFVSTDTEKLLRRENRMYEKAYAEIPRKQQILSESISILQQKDSRIYEEVFHSQAPGMDPVSSLDFLFGADTIPDAKIVTYTSRKADALLGTASEVDAAFEKIYRTLASEGFHMPPMANPVKDVSYPQIGASVGKKINPFYKAEVTHHGLDVIVPQGSSIFSPEAGVVREVVRTNKGDGNVVELEHPGGYVTRFLHLGEIYVAKGQNVKRGDRIASVGMSGNSYAPHLHYEVLKDGKELDPVNFIFGSLSPADYANFLYMSANTRQSMD